MSGQPPLDPAAPWSLIVGWVGVWSILGALALFVGAAFFYIAVRSEQGSKLAQRLFAFGSLGFVGAFVSLLVLFLNNQFQFLYVFNHSAADHETQYLLAGVWSGQEGSFLLWGILAALVGVVAARSAGPYRRWFTIVYSVFLAAIAGILAFESPFNLVPLVSESTGLTLMPPDGLGMAPSLLNYWVVIHPPTIFLGFSTLTVLFAFSMAALMHRDAVSWIPFVRPWAILVLTVLGVGLCMGGFWAYETLGWGGFWMWDPVENTSFVPWCAVVVFVHGMFVQQARKKWFLANVIFCAVPFLLFLYGTFMTRSGFLGDTSVHSFAKMDSRALWLLIGLTAAAILGFVAAAFVNWRKIRAKLPAAPPMKTAPINRGTLYSIGAWLLYAITFVTAYGMSYPLVLSLAGQKPKIIEEVIYHQNLAWLFPPLMIAMAVAPFVSWRGMGFRPLMGRITNVLAITIGLIGCILLWMKSGAFHPPGPDETVRLVLFDSTSSGAEDRTGLLSFDVPKVSWVLFLTWLCLFTAVAAFWRLIEVWKKSKSSVGAMLAHFGLATALLGLIFSRGFEQKKFVLLHESEAPSAFGYSLQNLGQTSQFSDRHNKIEIEATGPDGSFTIRPGLYYIQQREGDPAPMVWPSIIRFPLKDYYFTIYQPSFEATGLEEIPLSDVPEERRRAFQDMVLVYNDLRKTGQRGVDDVVFIAEMTAVFADGAYEVEPAIIVTKEGRVIQVPVRINDTYNLVLSRVDSATLAITVQLEYIQPAYPLEVFFKPLTVFVWLGVGTMLVGGLLAAAARRKEMRAFAKKQDAS